MVFDLGTALSVTTCVVGVISVTGWFLYFIANKEPYMRAWSINQVLLFLMLGSIYVQSVDLRAGVLLGNAFYCASFFFKFEAFRLMSGRDLRRLRFVYAAYFLVAVANFVSAFFDHPYAYEIRGIVLSALDIGTGVYVVYVMTKAATPHRSFDPLTLMPLMRRFVVFAASLTVLLQVLRIIIVLRTPQPTNFLQNSPDIALSFIGLVGGNVLFAMSFLLAVFELFVRRAKTSQSRVLQTTYQHENEKIAAVMNHELNGPIGNIELLASYIVSEAAPRSPVSDASAKILESLAKVRSIVADRNLLFSEAAADYVDSSEQIAYIERMLKRLPLASAWKTRITMDRLAGRFPRVAHVVMLAAEALLRFRHLRDHSVDPGVLGIHFSSTHEDQKIEFSVELREQPEDAVPEGENDPAANFDYLYLQEIVEAKFGGALSFAEEAGRRLMVIRLPLTER